ncbi:MULTISPECIES: antibiotic biosynthesis monooxygenase family protein [Serratia]|uniref:antibiotic biosynthesis monooxygenase family protein n=1 Tax=Serratia TaxID=613 RepID=UPI0004F76279|nr:MULTISPECIES: hypothetical protein [Serratia]AIM21921.1 hypothetical protein SERRSCBI_11605 [Serratia sp. SCBI]MBH3121728.1 hypothetical protein [Serratia ureilytica]MBH3155506.1 hypothetical protein [Serratia ureilytica]MBH3250599.1 hypothetical protein [Serratia ureilytica]MBN5280833.1 hypothetical protein [Serratia ureilytica]
MNYESKAVCSANSYIIEISSFKLPASLSPEAFAVLDKRVEEEFISNQNGFISRDSGISVDNEPRWVNIVKWETLLDADENIYQFTQASAPASVKEYLASIGAEPVELQRYQHTGA